MNSYERVLTALRHQEPDRIPFDLDGCCLTGMNVNCYKGLRRFLGLPEKEPRIYDLTQQLAKVDEDVLNLLKVDVRGVDPDPVSNAPLRVEPYLDPSGKYWRMKDELGIGWSMPVVNGHYFDMTEHPLANITDPDELDNYIIPRGDDPSRFTTMKLRADHYRFEEQKAYILGRHNAGIWELALWTSGFEKFFCDMMTEKEYAHKLMRKITDYKLQYWEIALKTVGSNVLIISEADDLATQNSQLCSLRLYKQMISPYHKELYDFIRQEARKNGVEELYIFYHTCGSMLPFAETLKEEGVDILNPVQVSAKDMDSKKLKKEIGDMFTFWGGGVDTQHILPFGTVQQVKDEVRRRIEDFAPGGGFVFSTVHNTQSDVPPENYMAMWETLQEYGAYE
jgi:uroporphyrinogen decarboxylase